MLKRYVVLAKYLLLTICWTLPLSLCRGLKDRRRRSGPGDSFDIVCLSHVPWSGAWQRNHHTMYKLSKRHKVVYCYPVHICGDNFDFLSAEGVARRESHGNPDLLVIEPRLLSGERRLPLLKSINKILLVAAINEASARMKMGTRILWFYSPLNEYLAGELDEALVVYDIQDEYCEYLGRPDFVREREMALLGKAELVFTGTYALYESKKKYNESIHFIPCGVDVAHFKKARTGNAAQPEDISRFEHPIVGYFGRVCGRMDTDLLGAMADSHPDWSIVLIGEIVEQDFQLEKRPNVWLLGQKDYSELPRYVQAFDVCMIPFVLNELTLKVNPTKLLEYMAAGKPVVSTAIPDMVRFYGDVIEIARSKQEFIAAVESTLEENRSGASDAVIRGMTIAEECDWTATIANMESLIRTRMGHRHGVG